MSREKAEEAPGGHFACLQPCGPAPKLLILAQDPNMRLKWAPDLPMLPRRCSIKREAPPTDAKGPHRRALHNTSDPKSRGR
jgi:hypothetical protein